MVNFTSLFLHNFIEESIALVCGLPAYTTVVGLPISTIGCLFSTLIEPEGNDTLHNAIYKTGKNSTSSTVMGMITSGISMVGSNPQVYESTGSLIPTASGIAPSAAGASLLKKSVEEENVNKSTIGTLMTSLGTSASAYATEVYNNTIEQLQITQAYVESLDEEQLSEMIAKLEQKDIELSIQEQEYTKTI